MADDVARDLSWRCIGCGQAPVLADVVPDGFWYSDAISVSEFQFNADFQPDSERQRVVLSESIDNTVSVSKPDANRQLKSDGIGNAVSQ